MPVLEPVVATLVANVDQFVSSVGKAEASMGTLPAAAAASSAETTAAMDALGPALQTKLGTVGTMGGTALKNGLSAEVQRCHS